MDEPKRPAKRFQDLVVWQRAHAFVLDAYRCSAAFPKNEMYGLTSQFRRAAVSVPANIAEGFKRRTKPEKIRFLNIAQGSLEEARYFLILAKDLDYGNYIDVMARSDEVARLLERFIQSIEDSM
jgi:four helix bundle protein